MSFGEKLSKILEKEFNSKKRPLISQGPLVVLSNLKITGAQTSFGQASGSQELRKFFQMFSKL